MLEFILKDGREITTPANFNLIGAEMLIPSIMKLRNEDGDYTFRDMNGEIKIKASDIVSVKVIF